MIIDPGDGDALALLERLAERASVRPMLHGPGTALVLGGARSGKSTWAEQQLEGCEDVEYVATSIVDPDDAEWVERVALHRARRPAGWNGWPARTTACAARWRRSTGPSMPPA